MSLSSGTIVSNNSCFVLIKPLVGVAEIVLAMGGDALVTGDGKPMSLVTPTIVGITSTFKFSYHIIFIYWINYYIIFGILFCCSSRKKKSFLFYIVTRVHLKSLREKYKVF
jgi:hypothetical protein